MPLLAQDCLDKIEQMPAEKRQRLLAAAMAEFCKGYKAASTDAVTAAAGISKGLLFHYFTSKQVLLTACALVAMEAVQKDFLSQVNFEEGDFFRRLWRIISVRFELMARYPALFDFLRKIHEGICPEFKALGAALAEAYPGAFPLSEDAWYSGVDAGLFKEGLDVEKAVNTVRWAFAGYTASLPSLWETGEDPARLNQRAKQTLWDYISFFRRQFYRPR